MKIVYALLYDVGDGGMEISGIYNTLESAKSKCSVTEWKEHEGVVGFWEGFDTKNSLWYIEAHALQN